MCPDGILGCLVLCRIVLNKYVIFQLFRGVLRFFRGFLPPAYKRIRQVFPPLDSGYNADSVDSREQL